MNTHPKYFGTDGIRGCVGQSLIAPEFVLKLGWAVGAVLRKEGQPNTALIGKDTRISGYMLESALEAGLSAAGMDIRLLGPMPTPGIAYLTRTFRASVGVVISASHNMYQDNGIKFFSPEGKKIYQKLEMQIEEAIDQPLKVVDSARLGKATRVVDAAGRYIEFCKSTVPNSVNLKGMKIVVDCANGATYHIAGEVLRELGASVIEIHTDPDGFNINRHAGSTHPTILQQTVRLHGADLGIAFDGDGDRVVMIDHYGNLVDGDELLFIMARDLKQHNQLQGGVVGTVMSNFGLEKAFTELNIPFVRGKVGDRFVMEKLEECGWLLGGEPSGHIVNLGLTTTGDGIISALQVLRAICQSGKMLAELKQGMHKLPNVLVNVPLNSINKTFVPTNAIDKIVKSAEKLLGNSGRILLRPSGTEPLIRIMVEGEDAELVNKLAQQIAEVVETEQRIKKEVNNP